MPKCFVLQHTRPKRITVRLNTERLSDDKAINNARRAKLQALPRDLHLAFAPFLLVNLVHHFLRAAHRAGHALQSTAWFAGE